KERNFLWLLKLEVLQPWSTSAQCLDMERANVLCSQLFGHNRQFCQAVARTVCRSEAHDTRNGSLQRLESLGDLHISLIATPVAIECPAFDGRELRGQKRRSGRRGELVLPFGRFELVLGVVREPPRQPVGGPVGVRGLHRLGAEWKCRSR